MILCITGGRDFTDREFVFKTLDRVHAHRAIECLVYGGARGADNLSALWAKSRGIKTKLFPAQWERFGKSAGYRRNTEMLESGIDGLVAFPGGRGTAHMKRETERKGITVYTPSY